MKLPRIRSLRVAAVVGLLVGAIPAGVALKAAGRLPGSDPRFVARSSLCLFQALFLEERLETTGLPAERLLEELARPLDVMRVTSWLVDAEGSVIGGPGGEVAFAWSELPRPEQGGAVRLHRADGNASFGVVRLRTRTPRYLVCDLRNRQLASWTSRETSRALIVVSFLAGALGVVLFLWLVLRARANDAAVAIGAIRAGNLRARLPVSRRDEIGKIMAAFNELAEHAEGLDRRVRDTQNSKTQFLQELAHDLRTPLTSLRLIFENIADNGMDAAEQRRCVELAVPELEYLGRLIDDLFFLAQVTDVAEHPELEPVDLRELLEREVRRLDSLSCAGSGGKAVEPELHIPPDLRCLLVGNLHQLTRLFRNALDNACRFARPRIAVSVTGDDDHLRVRVQDDGPGFPAAALQTFGQRNPVILPKTPHQGRVSLGLGSVIMSTIAEVAGGELRVSNWRRNDGSVGGAELEIALPRRFAAR